MTNPMLAELDALELLANVWDAKAARARDDAEFAKACALEDCADDLREKAHTLADMAKRLEAAGRDSKRYAFLKTRAYIGVNIHKECLWTLRRIPEVIGTFDDDVDAAIDATQEGEG